MKMTKLDELRALMAKATPGPWTQTLKPSPSREDHGWRAMAMCGSKQMIAAPYPVAFECWDNEANASLITNAVNALPALIAVVEALKELLEAGDNCVNPKDNDDMAAMLRFGKAHDLSRAALAPFGENDEQKD